MTSNRDEKFDMKEKNQPYRSFVMDEETKRPNQSKPSKRPKRSRRPKPPVRQYGNKNLYRAYPGKKNINKFDERLYDKP